MSDASCPWLPISATRATRVNIPRELRPRRPSTRGRGAGVLRPVDCETSMPYPLAVAEGAGELPVPSFSNDSMIRRVHAQGVILLGGGRALLMQIAHPSVAQGVAEHNRVWPKFRQNISNRFLCKSRIESDRRLPMTG